MSDKNKKVKESIKEIYHKENKLKKVGITYGLLIITIVVFIVFTLIEPRFATGRNLFNIISQGSIIGILAMGVTIIIISGNFDISFAENAAICSILTLIFVGRYEMPLLIAYLIIFGIAIGISIINGIIIVYMGVPSFIATLGMEIILLGFGKWLTGGSILMFPYLPPEFKVLGKSKIAGLFPVPMIVFMIIAFCAVVFLETTFKGRHFYAVGCNFEAAKRVGININKVKFEAFLLMGMICGVAGITIASLFEAANPSIGDDAYLFPALIAALLGAVFLKEGIPNILGTVVAAVLMSGLTNGFTFLGFPLWIKEVIQGIILLLAISIVSTLKPGGIPSVKI